MHPVRSALLSSLLATAAPLIAQDMIGVTFPGQVLRIDRATGATTVLANGQIGKNCLCTTSDNRLISTVRSGTAATGFQYHLVQIDPFTGAETRLFGNTDFGDLRAMAPTRSSILAIREASPVDELIRINQVTGAVTVIGPTGFTGIQGMDGTTAGLRCWDLNAGLLLILEASGTATDLFPTVGGPAGLQWMATDPATRITYVGNGTIHQLNVQTGVTSNPVAIAGNPDLRGVEFTTSLASSFGTACSGSLGTTFVDAQQPFGHGLPLVTSSIRHAPGAVGVTIVGFSNTTSANGNLPRNLDPLLGTNGCFLNVSIDLTTLGIADPTGRMLGVTALPPGLEFFQFYVQHAAFEPVPGGTSWTNGLRVRVPL